MNIFILNSTLNGLDLIKSVASQNSIEGIICLDTSENENISDYLNNKKVLRLFSKKIINLKSYSMNSSEEKKTINFKYRYFNYRRMAKINTKLAN